MQIVFRKIDLRVVDAHIGVIGEGQANAVVQREDQLAVEDMILEPLWRGQRRRGLLTRADSQVGF